MRFIPLGNSSLKASVVGLGTWPLGGGYDWGPIDEKQAATVVEAALNQGINLIDTAPIYGDGASETLLGNVLQGKRSEVILASKCGLVKNGSWTDHDLRPDSIRMQLDASLQRLKTDYLDLYFIHYPDPKVPLAEAVGELVRLQQAGKIHHIGLCNVTAEQIAQAAQETEIACVQNEYSLLHPTAGERVFNTCGELHISFMGYGTLAGGILSGKYTHEPNFRRADARNYFYKTARGEGFIQANKTAKRVQKIATQKSTNACAVAGAWALNKADFILCGAKTAMQVVQNAAAADVVLSSEENLFLESGCES